MFPYLASYLPEKVAKHKDFVAWLDTENLMEDFTTVILMVLPGDRLNYYETSNVAKMRADIYQVMNEISSLGGDYPLKG